MTKNMKIKHVIKKKVISTKNLTGIKRPIKISTSKQILHKTINNNPKKSVTKAI